MDSFLEFKNAEAQLAQLAEQLAEEKIPVQHATDGVAKVLGTKSAVKFLTHLRPGTEKHTSWDKVNTALTNQGVKTHHIAKIASHIKPAQYKEEAELGEEKDIIIRDKSGKVTKWSHEGDWHKSGPGTTTDKSGAKHTPYSKVRNLARTALKKTLNKEEAISEESGAYEKAEENKRSADSAKKQGDMFAHHLHMADHHDNLAQWHGEKGRHNIADQHARKSEEHHEKAMKLKEEVEQISEEIHRIGVTVSDPNHQAVTQRKEKVQKFVRVKGGSKEEALERGKKHFKGKGWKVHDAEHAGMVHEEVEIDEAKTPAEKMDFQRMMAGAMSRDDYNKKYKKGKYAVKSGKYRLDPSGIYHNLIKNVKEDTQIDELSNATLQSYKDKAMKSADELAAKGQHSKANDRYMKHMQASGKQIDRTMKNIHKAMQQRQQNEEAEIIEESDDEHFSKQSPKMQSAINLHLRKGKSYKDAVAAASKHVKEDTEIEEAIDKKAQLRDALARHSQHAIEANRRGDDEAVKVHQGYMNKIKDKMAKLARNQ